ncbi:unnamed protein product [Victoria cruziana]
MAVPSSATAGWWNNRSPATSVKQVIHLTDDIVVDNAPCGRYAKCGGGPCCACGRFQGGPICIICCSELRGH